jgi:hypothetical protein
MQSPQPTSDASTTKRQHRWLDATAWVLLALFWLSVVPPIVLDEHRHGGDIFRDAGSAANAAHGIVFADPAYPDHSIWYPPLSPAIFGLCSRLTGASPLDCYRWSQLVFNWLIPAGMYLLVRLQWGPIAATAATVALLFALPWWQCETVQGQPSVHAVVWAWVALLLYARQERAASIRWAAVCGLFQGLAFWHHPLIPTILAASFLMQSAWSRSGSRRDPDGAPDSRSGLIQNAVLFGLTIIVAAPALYMTLRGPVLNPVPREFIAPELRTTEFALMRLDLWLWGVGLIGLVSCLRRSTLGGRLVLSVLLLTVFGQLAAYPRVLGWAWAARLPLVVPHEFQWTFQLAWAVCAGIGIEHLVRTLCRWRPLAPHARRAGLVVAMAALALTGTRGLLDAPQNLRRFVHHHADNFPEATAWIRQETAIKDVFACEPIWAYAWLNAHTGRKVWLTEPGHSNPRVDWHRRRAVLDSMAEAPDPAALWRLTRAHDIDYLIPSPGWMPRVLAESRLQQQAVPAFFEVVYLGGPEDVAILRVRQSPAAPTPEDPQ